MHSLSQCHIVIFSMFKAVDINDVRPFHDMNLYSICEFRYNKIFTLPLACLNRTSAQGTQFGPRTCFQDRIHINLFASHKYQRNMTHRLFLQLWWTHRDRDLWSVRMRLTGKGMIHVSCVTPCPYNSRHCHMPFILFNHYSYQNYVQDAYST